MTWTRRNGDTVPRHSRGGLLADGGHGRAGHPRHRDDRGVRHLHQPAEVVHRTESSGRDAAEPAPGRRVHVAGHPFGRVRDPPSPDNVTINVTIPNNIIAAGVTSIRSLYAKDNTTGPDQIYILYLFDMDANQPPTLEFRHGDVCHQHIRRQHHRVSDDVGNWFSSPDDTTADLFQITPPLREPPLTFGRRLQLAAATPYVSDPGYPAPSTVAKARFVRYFIDSTTDPAHPTLMVDRMGGAAPQPLADDIEDMQLTYGVDLNGNGFIDSGEWTPSSGQSVAGPAGPAAIHRADAPPGGGVVGDTAGARQPGRRNDAGRLSPPDLRHRDRCPEFGSVTG